MNANRVQIKVCGITKFEDARKCAALGVDMIGLNLYRKSPRYIEPEHAREIVESLLPKIRAVGVFVDAPAEEVRKTAKIVDLSCIQLHGNASPAMCRELAQDFRVIRAFQTTDDFRPESIRDFAECDALLDAHHPDLRGGTGQTCDWAAAKKAVSFTRFLFLSGGLNASNVREAIATVAPQAVDVCSGVESAPGLKDHAAIESFVAALRSQ